MRLIGADATIPMIKYATTDNEIGIFPIKIGYDDIVKVLNAQPTVDAEPVRHGKWKQWDEDDYGDTYECTSCGEAFVMLEGSPIENGYHYCPYCGAKMDERKEE